MYSVLRTRYAIHIAHQSGGLSRFHNTEAITGNPADTDRSSVTSAIYSVHMYVRPFSSTELSVLRISSTYQIRTEDMLLCLVEVHIFIAYGNREVLDERMHE